MVFSRHHARLDELQQVAGAAGLGAGARQAVAAERLAGDHRAGDLAVDVEVADRACARRRGRPCRGLRENRPPVSANGERVDAVAGVLDVAHALDGEQRAEDLLVQHGRVGGQVGGQRSGCANQPSSGHLARAGRRSRPLALGQRARSARRAPAPRARSPAGRRCRRSAAWPTCEHLDRAGEALDAARRGSPRGTSTREAAEHFWPA